MNAREVQARVAATGLLAGPVARASVGAAAPRAKKAA